MNNKTFRTTSIVAIFFWLTHCIYCQNSITIDNAKHIIHGDNGAETIWISGNNGTGDNEYGLIYLRRSLSPTVEENKVVLSADVYDGGYISLAAGGPSPDVRLKMFGVAGTGPANQHGQLFISGDSQYSVVPAASFRPLIHLKNSARNADWKMGIYEDGSFNGMTFESFPGPTHMAFEYEGTLVANIDENGNWSSTSDERLKKNIRRLDKVIPKLMKLNPSNYEMKNSPGKNQIGFIAQNIAANFPELTNQYDNGSYNQYFVNYSGMIPVLTKAIQEQQEIIKSLTERLDKLENKE